MADSTPSWDNIKAETGQFTVDGLKLTWNNLLGLAGPSGSVPQAVQLARDLLEPKVLTSGVTTNQNDLIIGRASAIVLTGSTNLTISGFTAPDAGHNRILIVLNVGTAVITLLHENVGSQAGNRLHLRAGGNTAFGQDGGMILLYYSSRWHQVA